jgi:hypothetical protein
MVKKKIKEKKVNNKRGVEMKNNRQKITAPRNPLTRTDA